MKWAVIGEAAKKVAVALFIRSQGRRLLKPEFPPTANAHLQFGNSHFVNCKLT